MNRIYLIAERNPVDGLMIVGIYIHDESINNRIYAIPYFNEKDYTELRNILNRLDQSYEANKK